MNDINVELLQWFKIFLIKSPLVGYVKIEAIPNKQLAKGLHEPIGTKIEKCKVYSCFKDNI